MACDTWHVRRFAYAVCVTRGVCAVCRVCYVRTQVGTGLLTYPVLMAADILLYRAALVPANCIMIDHF